MLRWDFLGNFKESSVPLPGVYLGVSKPSAMSEAYLFDGSTNQGTMHVKVESDAPFSRVRIRAYNRTGAADNRVKASVAASEVLTNDTNSNRYNPIIGGTVDNDSWELAKWSGANEVLLASATSTNPSVSVSDWVDIESIPSTDSSKHVALVKYMLDPSNGTVVTSTSYNLWRGASAEPFFRIFDGKSTTGDNTETTTIPTEGFTGGMYWFSVEFDYTVPVKSVYALGDSITAGGGGQIYGFDSWGLRAVNTVSTPADPFVFTNGGMSGNSSRSFVDQFIRETDNGMIPYLTIMPAFTPNDGSPDADSAAAMIANIQQVSAKCQEIGSKLLVWSGLPNDGYGSDTFRDVCNDWARDTGNQTVYSFDFLDWDLLVGTGANPNRFKAGWTTDGIHPDLVAIEAMSSSLQDYISAL
jgi:lysophospholipase L1-like esterase